MTDNAQLLAVFANERAEPAFAELVARHIHLDSFEIIYQGSRSDLTNIPPRRVALIREQQPWLAPDGNWARTYGYADGAASIVESDDNFQSWDAQHVIPPAASGQ